MIGKDIQYACRLLKAGQLVAMPTETVYGLAGNALNPRAVAAIFAVKNRPSFDPLIIHLPDFPSFAPYIATVRPELEALARAFLPGPLTLLLEKSSLVPDLVTAGSPRVAIRVPAHPVARELLGQLDFPLAAPSANPFGYISPTTARHVEDQLGAKIPYILDGGPCTVGVESTILGFESGRPVIYRKGGLAIETIEKVVGEVAVKPYSSSNPQAPGMLKSHYAPSVPFFLAAALHRYPAGAVLIRFREYKPGWPEAQQHLLSPSGDYEEAARRLFALMRELDGSGAPAIVAELLPEEGLGRAVNDRLRRAAAQG